MARRNRRNFQGLKQQAGSTSANDSLNEIEKGKAALIHEEIIKLRDIELEGKNERIHDLLAEVNILRNSLSISNAAVDGLMTQLQARTRKSQNNMQLSSATLLAVTVAIFVLLTLTLLCGTSSWSPSFSQQPFKSEACPAPTSTTQSG